MESLDTAALFMDDFLDFSDEEDDYETPQTSANHHLHHHCTPFSLLHCTDALTHSFPGYVEEEELEWISNKDTFPMVESLVDFIPNIASSNYNDILNTSSSVNNNHQSPISVLENSTSSGSGGGGFTATLGHGRSVNNGRNMMMINLSSNFKVPGKARTKHGRKRREMLGPQFQCWSKPAARPPKSSSIIGRKCLHCGSEKTPQWRAGPLGPKTLCNACGVRYKSGRLCDEYRPASSPTFSNEHHSNSHRKVVELRRLKNEKMMMMMGTGFALKPGPADIV